MKLIFFSGLETQLSSAGFALDMKSPGVQSPALEREKNKAELLLDRLGFIFESFCLLQAVKQLLSLRPPSYMEAEIPKEHAFYFGD